MDILKKPWFIAVVGLLLAVGTQFIALKMSWSELFPEREETAVVVKRDAPEPLLWGFSSAEIDELKIELINRLSALDVRERELDEYASRLETDRAEIEEIKERVEMMQDKLMDDIVQLETAEQKNLKTLAKTYSTLTPDAAVNIFKELDDPTVVKILFFMKSDTVGAILQEMATAAVDDADNQLKRAAKLSDMLRLFTDATKNEMQPNI